MMGCSRWVSSASRRAEESEFTEAERDEAALATAPAEERREAELGLEHPATGILNKIGSIQR